MKPLYLPFFAFSITVVNFSWEKCHFFLNILVLVAILQKKAQLASNKVVPMNLSSFFQNRIIFPFIKSCYFVMQSLNPKQSQSPILISEVHVKEKSGKGKTNN